MLFVHVFLSYPFWKYHFHKKNINSILITKTIGRWLARVFSILSLLTILILFEIRKRQFINHRIFFRFSFDSKKKKYSHIQSLMISSDRSSDMIGKKNDANFIIWKILIRLIAIWIYRNQIIMFSCFLIYYFFIKVTNSIFNFLRIKCVKTLSIMSWNILIVSFFDVMIIFDHKLAWRIKWQVKCMSDISRQISDKYKLLSDDSLLLDRYLLNYPWWYCCVKSWGR